MHPEGTRTDRRWILGCALLAFGLRVFRIGHQDLWIDEMISLGLATYADGSAFWRGLLHDIHGPFTSALLHLWVRGGLGEAWLRLLYAVPSALAVPVLAALARRLFGARVARVAALAAAVSPFLVWYAQEVRAYSWAILWVTATLALFLRAWDGEATRRTWLGLGAVVVAGVLTNYSFVLLLVALTACAALRRPFDRRFATAWAGVLGVTAVVFLPWFLDWYQRIGGERILTGGESPAGVALREAAGFSVLDLGYLFWTFTFGYSLGPSLRQLHLDRSLASILAYWPVLVPGGIVAAAGAVLGLREARRAGRLPFVLLVCGIPLVLAVALAVREVKTFHPRYLAVFFPVFLAVLAAGWSVRSRVARGAGWVALGLAAVSLGNHYFDPAYGKEHSRAAATWIREQEQPGDSVVVIYAFRPFRHYFSDTADGAARLHHVHKRFLRTDEQMRAHVDEASRGAGRVWLVLSRWWDVAPEPRIRAAFESRLREQGRWDFEGVKVTLYEGAAT